MPARVSGRPADPLEDVVNTSRIFRERVSSSRSILTHMFTKTMRAGAIFVCALILLFAFASLAAAQENTDLQSTIRAAILSDPRSSQMSGEEIEGLVTALADEAQSQGVNSEDIAWRPQESVSSDEAGGEAREACGYAAFLCALNDAFGFTGSPLIIPLLLGVCSALLLFVIGSILLHSHGHHPIRGLMSSSSLQ